MKRRPQRERGIHKNILIPGDLVREVEEEFWPAHLKSNPDADPGQSSAYITLLRRGLKYSEGGREKSPPAQLGPSVLVPWSVRYFHHSVNPNQFTDDGALKRAMDKFEGMVWADDPNGKNIYSNRELQKRTGLSADQFRDYGWKNVIHAGDADRIFEEFTEKSQARQPFDLIYRLRLEDESFVWIYDFISPRYYPDGSFAGFVGTMIEVVGPGAIVEIRNDPSVRRIQPLVIAPKTSLSRQAKAS